MQGLATGGDEDSPHLPPGLEKLGYMGAKCILGAHGGDCMGIGGSRGLIYSECGDGSHHSAPAENADPVLPVLNDFQEKMEIRIFM